MLFASIIRLDSTADLRDASALLYTKYTHISTDWSSHFRVQKHHRVLVEQTSDVNGHLMISVMTRGRGCDSSVVYFIAILQRVPIQHCFDPLQSCKLQPRLLVIIRNFHVKIWIKTIKTTTIGLFWRLIPRLNAYINNNRAICSRLIGLLEKQQSCVNCIIITVNGYRVNYARIPTSIRRKYCSL